VEPVVTKPVFTVGWAVFFAHQPTFLKLFFSRSQIPFGNAFVQREAKRYAENIKKL